MKKILNYLPFAAVIAAQFLISSYSVISVLTIVTGFIAAYIIEHKRVFLNCFLFGLVVFTTVFLIYQPRVDYLNGLFVNIGLSSSFIYVLPLFNALNTAILYFFGYKIWTIIYAKKLIRA